MLRIKLASWEKTYQEVTYWKKFESAKSEFAGQNFNITI